MADRGAQEKTEQPTGKRLADSRQKGQVARSVEVNTFVTLFAATVALSMLQGTIGEKVTALSKDIFSNLNNLTISRDMLTKYAIEGVMYFAVLLAPFFLILFIAGLVSGYGQVGYKFTLEPLKPKFSKLNPFTGIKNLMISTRSLVELAKSIAKLFVVGLFSYWMLADIIKVSVGLIDLSIIDSFRFMLDAAFSFLWKISLVYIVIAILDLWFQRKKHKKELMMSKQDVKEENKQTEGDPLIKSRIRGKQIAMARSRMMREIPKADVVITNPTHYAIALKYEFGKQIAPKVIAKGKDLVALRIREIAEENNVPIHEDPPLARALYKYCEVGDEIPEALFKTVAQILAYIYKQKQQQKMKRSIV